MVELGEGVQFLLHTPPSLRDTPSNLEGDLSYNSYASYKSYRTYTSHKNNRQVVR